MSFTAAPDTRRAMREALHRLVHEADDWSRPSLTVFRNRLLDEVSSDARPLANLLVEAIDRGVLDALPKTAMSPPAWSARSTPFVMRWVADRFLQPEVARWAVEAWGYALGCIDTSQLTASVDAPEPVPMAPSWAIAGGAAPGARAAGVATPSGGSGALPPTRRGLASPPSTGGAVPWRGAGAPARPLPRAPGPAYRPPRPGSAASSWAVANATRVAVGTAAIAMLSYVYIFYSAATRQASALAEAPAARSTAPLTPDPGQGQVDGSLGGLAASDALLEADPARGRPTVQATYGLDDVRARQAERANASGDRRRDPAAQAVAAAAAARGIGVGGRATVVPLTAGTGSAPSLALTRLPAEGATPTAFLELAARATTRREGDDASAPSAPQPAAPTTPGVPSITRNALPLRGDVASALRVRPATRPARQRPLSDNPFARSLPNTVPTSEPMGVADADRAGLAATAVAPVSSPPSESAADSPPAPASAPSAAASASARPTRTVEADAIAGRNAAATPGLDQLRLRSGRRITGRVEVIRASSVVFRDAETGLRYEFAKNDIDEIITEFGSAVRFRSAASAASGSDRRVESVAGRYAVTYEAARVNGSPACRDLWRGPSGRDAAVVRHRAGDDTLTVAFDGGDQFPSVLDADGFFSSTFRIMPGQEQLATALTTRLTGRFGNDGSLALQVNVIGYRRVQGTRGVACHIIVDATGRRQP